MTQVMVTSPTSTVLVIVEQASVFVGRETELIAIAGGGGPVFVANRSSLDAIWLRGRLIDSAAPNANDVLTWDAVLGRWVGRAVGIGDISFSDLTGQIANAQVPASAVTQHQATLAIAWGQLAGVPATFPPSFHEHPWSQITATPTTLAGYGITDAALEADLDAHVADLANPHAVDAAQVGAYTIAAVDAIASGLSAGTATVASNLATHVANIANPHAVTKAQVGLALAENVALSTWAGSAAITTIGTLVAGGVPYSLLAGAVPTWNQNTSGNAATATLAAAATVLATPRAINGVNFDGSAPITVTAAAETLTGTALNATVVTSSLTAIGTLVAGTVPTSLLGGALAYAQLPTGGGTWANGDNLTLTGGSLLVSGLVHAGARMLATLPENLTAIPVAQKDTDATIGNIIPGYQLQTNTNAATLGGFRYGPGSGGTGLSFAKSLGADPNTRGAVASGNILGAIVWGGDDGTDMRTLSAKMDVRVSAAAATNRVPAALRFWTAAGLADDDASIKLQITPTGNIGIGALAQFNLDGSGATGDTYLTESSANVLDFVVGGANTMKVSSTLVTLPSTFKLVVGHTALVTVDGKQHAIQVHGLASASASAIAAVNWSNGTGCPSFSFGKSRSNVIGSQLVINANDALGDIRYAVSDGVDMTTLAARILVLATAGGSANRQAANMTFYTAAGLADDDITATLRLGPTGAIGMRAAVPFYLDGIALTGDTYFYESAANTFDLFVGGTNTFRSTATAITLTGTVAITGVTTLATSLTGLLRADAGVVSVASGVGVKTLFDHFVDANNGTTVETDLYSDTIPAARLAANGEKLVEQFAGIVSGDATSNQRLRVYFGGTLIYDSTAVTFGVTVQDWNICVTIMRVSSSIVRCSVALSTSVATTANYAKSTEVTGLTLANTQVLKITGTAAGATGGSNQITAKESYVTWVPAA